MLPIGSLIQETRVALGLTQAELSRRASVSLPSIQNIENGRSENPSLETISSLFVTLGLELCAAPKKPDWNAFIACGAPLTAPKKTRLPEPSFELLLESLRSVCLYLSVKMGTQNREGLAAQAVLLALKSYYPSLYRKHCARSSLFSDFYPKHLSGALIKLKRQTATSLAAYL
jgi:transcriptional regulator with XRE-family HTH domain